MGSKEDFKRELDMFRKSKELGKLKKEGKGYLRCLEWYENLILCEVGCSKPIKSEIDFIIYKGKKYVHKTDLEALIDNGTYVDVS